LSELKIDMRIQVYDNSGVPIVHLSLTEDESKLKHVAMLIYKLKQVEQEFIDRQYSEEGFDIEKA